MRHGKFTVLVFLVSFNMVFAAAQAENLVEVIVIIVTTTTNTIVKFTHRTHRSNTMQVRKAVARIESDVRSEVEAYITQVTRDVSHVALAKS